MIRNTLIATTTAAALLAAPSFAAPQAGDRELILGASGSNDRGFHSGGFNLNGELGYYVTDEWLVSARQSIDYADASGGSTSILGTGAAIDYHFDFGQFRPFVGATLTYLYGNGVANTLAAGPEVGVKWHVKPETFIYGRANYEWAFRSSRDARHNFNDGRFHYTVGIGFNF